MRANSKKEWAFFHPEQSLAEEADRLAALFAPQSAAERLSLLRKEVVGRIVFTTSFGLEDQIITDLLSQQGIDVDVVTLDTGRLFEETYAVWVATERRYGIKVRPYYPRRGDIEDLVARQGINGFYESKSARLACCQIRKVDPLNRALDGARGWITGLRSEQSAHRRDMSLVAADKSRGLIKLSPLFDWTQAQLLSFTAEHQIPVNSLHAKGFASIGCAPCTRAIAPDEPERAGRWWWEDDQKECGLHLPTAVAP